MKERLCGDSSYQMALVEAVRTDAVRDKQEHARDALADLAPKARQSARDVARVLDRTAKALDHSARLAELHAERQERAGQMDLALQEW